MYNTMQTMPHRATPCSTVQHHGCTVAPTTGFLVLRRDAGQDDVLRRGAAGVMGAEQVERPEAASSLQHVEQLLHRGGAGFRDAVVDGEVQALGAAGHQASEALNRVIGVRRWIAAAAAAACTRRVKQRPQQQHRK